jgi:hypothetical protein
MREVRDAGQWPPAQFINRIAAMGEFRLSDLNEPLPPPRMLSVKPVSHGRSGTS